MVRLYLIIFACVFVVNVGSFKAQQDTLEVVSICPTLNIQKRSPDFDGQGIILTYFDRVNIWAYEVQRDARYPLPETSPCGTNCHLSPDLRWISYLNSTERRFEKMRLNGTERTPLADYATDISWWDADTLLLWTPTHLGFLRPERGPDMIPLEQNNIISVQPGGNWALSVEYGDMGFNRVLIPLNLTEALNSTGGLIPLGPDVPYFNAGSWSPDGGWYAFVNPIIPAPGEMPTSAEIAAIRPGETFTQNWTTLTQAYGPVRINGHAPGVLSWSPDGKRLAFWVIPMTGSDPTTTRGIGTIHVLDTMTGVITAYCGLTTFDHTPNPPRLIWSPDGNYLALAANPAYDDRGYLLLALDTRNGLFTELSAGLYPALGHADIIAWGLLP